MFHLQYTVKDARRAITVVRRQPITSVSAGSQGYLSLRVLYGVNRVWYDGLALPEKGKLFVVPSICHWVNRGKAHIRLPILNTALTLDNYDLLAHYYDALDGDKLVEVTIDMKNICLEI